jgi:phasin family protein
MFPIQDQISEVTKASIEAQLARINALNHMTFQSVQKLFDLNINLVKTSMEESAIISRQLMAAKDPQEFFSLIAAQAKPNAEKALLYTRHLANIASTAQAEFARTVEEQVSETNRKVSKLVDDAAKNAPPGAENVVALVKSAIDNANSGYEQLTKTTKQATEAFEATISAAANQLAHAGEKVVNAK